MKRTSRRTFGKQLAGALAAVPLASRLAEARIDDQQKKSGGRAQQKRSDDRVHSKFESEHNTPPPALLMGGSLVFEAFSEKDDWDIDGDVDTSINRRRWTVKPKAYETVPPTQPTNICIAHIKFIDGAGEMVFPTYNNESNKETPIVITATLTKNGQVFGDCRLTAVGDHFEIDLPINKRLKKKSGDPSANSRRQRVRYMHPNIGNPDACEWVGLRIIKGSEVIYE